MIKVRNLQVFPSLLSQVSSPSTNFLYIIQYIQVYHSMCIIACRCRYGQRQSPASYCQETVSLGVYLWFGIRDAHCMVRIIKKAIPQRTNNHFLIQGKLHAKFKFNSCIGNRACTYSPLEELLSRDSFFSYCVGQVPQFSEICLFHPRAVLGMDFPVYPLRATPERTQRRNKELRTSS